MLDRCVAAERCYFCLDPLWLRVGYYARVWSRSAHTRLIDKPMNDALRLVTGCLRPTPTGNLFVLSGITTTELCRKRATLSLACRPQELGHLLQYRLTSHPYGGHRRLKSRHPFVPAALELLRNASELGTSAARWAEHRWSTEWREGTSRLHLFFDDMNALSPGMGFTDSPGPAEPFPPWSWPLSVIYA